VQTAAKAMISLGLEPKHSVGIIGFNSPEWCVASAKGSQRIKQRLPLPHRRAQEPPHSPPYPHLLLPPRFIADLGAIFAGGFASGLYTTNKSDAVQYVANHSRSQIMVVEDDTQLQKVLEVQDQLPHLKAIVQYIGKVEESLKTAKIPVLEWAEFMRRGHGWFRARWLREAAQR
jgi:long-chain-fatty-acid--CoA ligase ACSBG